MAHIPIKKHRSLLRSRWSVLVREDVLKGAAAEGGTGGTKAKGDARAGSRYRGVAASEPAVSDTPRIKPRRNTSVIFFSSPVKGMGAPFPENGLGEPAPL